MAADGDKFNVEFLQSQGLMAKRIRSGAEQRDLSKEMRTGRDDLKVMLAKM